MTILQTFKRINFSYTVYLLYLCTPVLAIICLIFITYLRFPINQSVDLICNITHVVLFENVICLLYYYNLFLQIFDIKTTRISILHRLLLEFYYISAVSALPNCCDQNAVIHAFSYIRIQKYIILNTYLFRHYRLPVLIDVCD